jgi:hypothetical protein
MSFFPEPGALFFLLVVEPVVVGTAQAGRGNVIMGDWIIHNSTC